MTNKFAGAGLISYHGDDVSPSVKSSFDSRHANVASGSDNQNGLHDWVECLNARAVESSDKGRVGKIWI